MFLSKSIAIDIDNDYMKIMYGNNKKVDICSMFKLPEGTVIDDRISNVEILKSYIGDFLKEKKVIIKDVLFVLRGSDIVIRNMELPVMKKQELSSSVEYEIGQFLPDGGANYYVDFEILEKIENEEKKVYNLMAVAVPRDKADVLVEIAKDLKLKLRAIDISANCVTRVFRNLENVDKGMDSIGIINIGSKKSSIILLDKGKLFIEREVPFGTDNVVREISKKFEINDEDAYRYFIYNFDFNKLDPENEMHIRIQTLFDNVMSSFAKVIQFFAIGRVKKELDALYIIGEQCEINGLDNYVSSYFSVPAYMLITSKKPPIKINLPKKCNAKYYITTVGLLLRKE